jgi:hypothetical protein
MLFLILILQSFCLATPFTQFKKPVSRGACLQISNVDEISIPNEISELEVIYVYMYIIYVYTYICICIHVYVYVYMYMYVCICMYVYIYIYIHINIHRTTIDRDLLTLLDYMKTM